jgi:uncharacterized membrane protein YbhN (UPF0104 family)
MVAAHPGWIVAALTANAAILLLWASQWRLFVPPSLPVPFRRMLGVTAAMAMVCNSVPFFLGQVTGFHLLATRGRTGHAAALSVTALDQLAEGTAKLTVLLLLAALTPLPGGLRAGLAALALAVAFLAGALVVLSRRERWLRSVVPALRFGWARRLLLFVAEGARHLHPLRQPRTFLLGVALALGMKAAEAGGILAVQHALGVDLPLWSVVLVLASVGLATMVSLAPANLGVYEAATFVAYTWMGVPAETALGLALVQHVCFLLPMLASGWLAVSVWRRTPDGESAAHPIGAVAAGTKAETASPRRPGPRTAEPGVAAD